MNPKQLFYEKQAATVIRHLEKRKMKGFYCPTKEDAVAVAMSLTAPDTTVCFGGSASLLESGVMDALKARTDITLIDRGNAKTPEEIQQAYRHAFLADSYFMSILNFANALAGMGHDERIRLFQKVSFMLDWYKQVVPITNAVTEFINVVTSSGRIRIRTTRKNKDN